MELIDKFCSFFIKSGQKMSNQKNINFQCKTNGEEQNLSFTWDDRTFEVKIINDRIHDYKIKYHTQISSSRIPYEKIYQPWYTEYRYINDYGEEISANRNFIYVRSDFFSIYINNQYLTYSHNDTNEKIKVEWRYVGGIPTIIYPTHIFIGKRFKFSQEKTEIKLRKYVRYWRFIRNKKWRVLCLGNFAKS